MPLPAIFKTTSAIFVGSISIVGRTSGNQSAGEHNRNIKAQVTMAKQGQVDRLLLSDTRMAPEKKQNEIRVSEYHQKKQNKTK